MENRHDNLVRVLKEGDSKEIPFVKIKEQLLKDNYTESEISNAVYQSSYDGKKDIVVPESEVSKLFRINPELTQGIGKQILEDDREQERQQVVASGVASRFASGRHAQAKYTFDTFEKLGLPFFKIFFALFVIYILVYKFDLPEIITTIASSLIVGWVGWSFYSQFVKKR